MNKKYNFNLRPIVLGALTLGLFTQFAVAELYVSPVVRNTITFNDIPNQSGSLEERAVSGSSSIHGNFEISKSDPSKNKVNGPVMQYGKNVPLFVALEKVIPNSQDWLFNYDNNLENTVVSWNGGDDWTSVVALIGKNSGINISINELDKSIGISLDANKSSHLAHRITQVWTLDTTKTLKQNLSVWATKAGWSVAWDPELKIDFPIEHNATLTGQFSGPDGVVGQILRSLGGKKSPLMAEFYELNKVVLIKESGFKQGALNK